MLAKTIEETNFSQNLGQVLNQSFGCFYSVLCSKTAKLNVENLLQTIFRLSQNPGKVE
jgi:hypothetical protein